MGNITHRHSQRGKRQRITIEVTPKSAKARSMLAKFKRDVKAFHAKWKKTFKKKGR
jgi:hypothetical protein